MAPKILIIDIETSPNLADVWGLWNQNVSLNQLREVTGVICWAAKWHGEKKVEFASDFHDGHHEQLGAAWTLLDQADAVVGHNVDQFDLKHLKREFLLNGFTPPSPYLIIDTLKIVKSQFRFSSNKLQHISTQLGQRGKVQHSGHDLWVKCMAGDPKAWEQMKKYNIGDVLETEDVFDKIRPWAPQSMTPNLALHGASLDGCPRCGGELAPRGFTHTAVSTYQRYRCADCGSWSRGKYALNRSELRGVA